jgi:hypothetical protein
MVGVLAPGATLMRATLPIATCRLQLTANFDFDAAAAIVPYQKALGITDHAVFRATLLVNRFFRKKALHGHARTLELSEFPCVSPAKAEHWHRLEET